MQRLYISKLPFSISTERGIRALFEEFGPVLSVHIFRDKRSGESRSCALVDLGDDEQAREAMRQVNGRMLGDSRIDVRHANGSGVLGSVPKFRELDMKSGTRLG